MLELDCVRCGELKDINAFTKVQRVAEDPVSSIEGQTDTCADIF